MRPWRQLSRRPRTTRSKSLLRQNGEPVLFALNGTETRPARIQMRLRRARRLLPGLRLSLAPQRHKSGDEAGCKRERDGTPRHPISLNADRGRQSARVRAARNCRETRRRVVDGSSPRAWKFAPAQRVKRLLTTLVAFDAPENCGVILGVYRETANDCERGKRRNSGSQTIENTDGMAHFGSLQRVRNVAE